MRLVTKRCMYTAAVKTDSSIWKSTINQHFRFNVYSTSQFLSGPRHPRPFNFAIFHTRGADSLVLQNSQRF